MSMMCVKCLICGESVELNEHEEMRVMHAHDIVKVCNGCKEAIGLMKKMIEAMQIEKAEKD